MRYPTANPRRTDRIAGLVRSERGNVAVLFAMVLPLVIGSAGFGVETSYWYYKHLQLQNAADTAAHAGALERRAGADEATVTTIATVAATQNGFDPLAGSITVHAPPTSGPNTGGDAVEVLLTFNAERFFTQFFAEGPVLITSRAVAAFNDAGTACVLALHPTDGSSAQFQGSATVTLDGCSVMANSVASDAVAVQGATIVSTDCLIASGGVLASGTITMTECDDPIENAPPVADPYADVPVPPVPTSGCPSANSTPTPGVRYCNGLRLSGTQTLPPGVYYITGGDLEFRSNSRTTADGVTFYIGANANIDLNGNAKVTLKAPLPTSGSPYAGILFFGDRNAVSKTATINGTADSRMTGAIYMSDWDITYQGNFTGENGCTQIVASKIKWTGNTTFAGDCTSFGIRPIPVMSLVKLTE